MNDRLHNDQQHVAPRAKAANPFRKGDRVQMNAVGRGKWDATDRVVGHVTEDPGSYMVAVRWSKTDLGAEAAFAAILAGKPIRDHELFHHCWLELVERRELPGRA